MYNVNKNKQEIDFYSDSKYYGQWQTDRIIEEYFTENFIGRCIEIGAADGVRGSNTLYFEKLGWDVLCIEPNPHFQESLKENRKHIFKGAVSFYTDMEYMTIFDVGEKNIMSSLSSLRPDARLVDDHKHIINESFHESVYVTPLMNVLKNHAENTPFHDQYVYDFISIDTEGTEIDVLRGIDFSKLNVTLYVVENNYEDKLIRDYMYENDYILDQRYKINDFYVRNV